MKTSTDNRNVAAYLMIIVIVAFAGYFMHRMTSILELHACPKTRIAVPATSAVSTNQVAVLAGHIDEIPKPQDCSPSIMEAYESLSNELSSWMAIMGIFAAVFGLLIPLGSFLLQRQSLKDEREAILGDLEKVKDKYAQLDKVEDRLDETEKQCKVIENAVNGTNKSFWKAIGRCFEYAVITNKYAVEHVHLPISAELANLFLSMELNFDCCVLAHDKKELEQQIQYGKIIINSLMEKHGDDVKKAYYLLKGDRQQRTELVNGLMYLEMLGSDDNLYKWLKSFFDGFDADKLP